MLTPRIMELEPIDVLYVRKTGDYMISCQEAWETLLRFSEMQMTKLNKDLLAKGVMRFGIGHDNPNVVAADKLRCDACISCDDDTIKLSGEISKKVIEGGKYARFVHVGPYERLRSMYDEIADWAAVQGIEPSARPRIEKYLDIDPRKVHPENLKTEIYIPID